MARTRDRLLINAVVAASLLGTAIPAMASRAEPVMAPWAQGTRLDPMAAYGDKIIFRVLRNGDPVGSHVVFFDRDGEDLIVRARFELSIEVLFVTAYRYVYESTARWRDGRLVSLVADTDENGTPIRVAARLEDGTLRISGPKGTATAPAGIFPTNHWHPGVLETNRVLNTLTGRVNAVQIDDEGVEDLAKGGKTLRARRFAYSGELDNVVWYDAAGRWVKMRFTGKDGSTIEYLCESCITGTDDPA